MLERSIICVGLLRSWVTGFLWHVIDHLGLKTLGVYI